jgi:hypothetical protein
VTDHGTDRVHVPAPIEDGSYDVEALGPFVDRLIGDHRVRSIAAGAIRAAGAETEPAEEADDASIEVPAPVPGGNEPVTREGPAAAED